MGIHNINFATLDLNLLHVLDAILRDSSTTKAGERLGLSQSAVSNALNRLRHALKDDLFIRQGNRLVATDYVETLRHELPSELERLEALLAPPAEFEPATAEGTFKISAADFFSEMLMPQLGDLLNRKAPGIRAQQVDLVPDNYVENIESSRADLALLPEATIPGWINQEPLFHSPYVVIARAKNPGIQDLKPEGIMPFDVFCDLPHVLFSPEGKLAAAGDAALAQVGRTRRVAKTVPFFSGVCRVVSGSDLIALLPVQLARKLEKDYGLKIFQPPMRIEPPRIIAIWHRRLDANPMAKWMRQQVFDLMKPLDDF